MDIQWLTNVTHTGRIMHDNTYSTNKEEVVKWAKTNARLGVKYAREAVVNAESELAKRKSDLAEEERCLSELEQNYPEVKMSNEMKG